MTKQERDRRETLLQFMLDRLGGTELNPLKKVLNWGEFISVEYEDGTKKDVSLLITNAEE